MMITIVIMIRMIMIRMVMIMIMVIIANPDNSIIPLCHLDCKR